LVDAADASELKIWDNHASTTTAKANVL